MPIVVKEIRFTIERTMPLEPLTGNSDDQYANVRPQACATVEVSADPDTEEGQAEIAKAFGVAQDACFVQLAKFREEFVAAINAK